MAQLVKTCAGLAIASVKTFNGLAIASVKTIAGLDNTSGGGADVAFDSAFESGSASQASPYSITSNTADVPGTVGSNSNRFLWACVAYRETGITITGVTWQGVAMTQIGTAQAIGGGEITQWGLIAPATGNGALVATFTGGSATMCMGAVSVYNVNQSSATQNSGQDSGTGTSASSTVTSASGNMVIVGHINDNATSTTISAGTSAYTETDLNGNYAAGYRVSTSGSTVVTWTLGSSVAWGNVKVDIIKA